MQFIVMAPAALPFPLKLLPYMQGFGFRGFVVWFGFMVCIQKFTQGILHIISALLFLYLLTGVTDLSFGCHFFQR